MLGSNYVKDSVNPYSIIQRAIDFILIQSLLFVSALFYGVHLSNIYIVLGLMAAVSFSLFAESVRLYRSWRTGLSPRLARYTLASWIFAVFVVVTFLFFSKTSLYISRITIAIWFVACALTLVGWRMAFRQYLFSRRRKGFNTRKVAIIGLTDSGERLANEFADHPETGFTLSAFFDDRQVECADKKYHEHLKGDVDTGVRLAKEGNFDVVYIALPLTAQIVRIEEILRALGDTTVDVYVLPDFFTFNLLNARLSYVGKTQMISVYESPMNGLSTLAKRLEDIFGSIIILFMIALPMLIISILIKLDSPGPVFFKQKRYGLDGKSINVWKFRSMTVADNGAVVKQATKGDTRITRLGAFLRGTSLDELPQFINVLQGHMSIVGPRPHAVAHNEEYRRKVDFYMLRHKVKPGITGWAQINGWRGETDTLDKMEKRVDFDLEYIRNWSIVFDIKIIYSTIFKGFLHKNAY